MNYVTFEITAAVTIKFSAFRTLQENVLHSLLSIKVYEIDAGDGGSSFT